MHTRMTSSLKLMGANKFYTALVGVLTDVVAAHDQLHVIVC